MNFQEAIIDKSILQKTNSIWNKCQVNHPWSIGYTSFLISQRTFLSFDDWVSHYFNSGDKRDILIDILKEKDARFILRTPDVPKRFSRKFNSLDSSLKKLNLEYGRSWESTKNRIHFFEKAVEERNINYTYQNCAKVFLQRVIIDTWNGRVREINTVVQIKELYPKLEFQDSDAWSDFNYGIDFKILKDGNLIAAIQIKPLSYRGKTKYISAAKKANKKKWARFEKEKSANVFLILSNERGEIQEENGLISFLKNHK